MKESTSIIAWSIVGLIVSLVVSYTLFSMGAGQFITGDYGRTTQAPNYLKYLIFVLPIPFIILLILEIINVKNKNVKNISN